MHSSRMRTAHLLPVSPSMQCSRGGVLVVYLSRGVPAQGMYLPGGVPTQRGYTCQGVYLPGGGVPTRECTCQEVYLPGGCTCPGGVSAQGGVPAWGCTCPGTPCGQTGTCKKHNLCKLRLRVVII